MIDLEQRIRDLPRPVPSESLDERITGLLSPARGEQRPGRPGRELLVATALAAGLAGFAAGIGTGRWIPGPQPDQAVTGPTATAEVPHSFVQFTDARVSAGLDFSQSLEPFRVQPVDQEGT